MPTEKPYAWAYRADGFTVTSARLLVVERASVEQLGNCFGVDAGAGQLLDYAAAQAEYGRLGDFERSVLRLGRFDDWAFALEEHQPRPVLDTVGLPGGGRVLTLDVVPHRGMVVVGCWEDDEVVLGLELGIPTTELRALPERIRALIAEVGVDPSTGLRDPAVPFDPRFGSLDRALRLAAALTTDIPAAVAEGPLSTYFAPVDR